MKLVYAEQAVADLVRLRGFISEKNPSAAARGAHELISRIEYLRAFPDMGRAVAQAPQMRCWASTSCATRRMPKPW